MTRKAPPRLHRPSLILQCHKDSHEVIVTIHLLSLNLSLISDRDNYCENGRSDWPGTADLVCQPVTLTKGKSLLWLVAPVAGQAAARPLYTWPEPVPAQSLSGAGGDNLSLARLSRYLLMPGTPVHGTERGERGQGAGPLATLTTGHWGLGILHKGTHFTMKRKYVILGRDYHVSVCQGSGGARRM